MRGSAESISTKPSTTNNRPVCRYIPKVPGHLIEHCPVIQRLGLCLPDTNSQPTSSSRPVTGPTPPSPPTSPMRSHENSYEHGSILESIQRQVATVEQTMNAGMEELVDNVSQVTVSTSFDTPLPSSPMPTGWKSRVMRSY